MPWYSNVFIRINERMFRRRDRWRGDYGVSRVSGTKPTQKSTFFKMGVSPGGGGGGSLIFSYIRMFGSFCLFFFWGGGGVKF